jgi:hypothetical protein
LYDVDLMHRRGRTMDPDGEFERAESVHAMALAAVGA